MMKLLKFALAVLVGCGDNERTSPAPLPCTTGSCVSDPAGHCVSKETCDDDGDCPAGTECRIERANACGANIGTTCHPRYVTHFDELSLIVHFGVPAMEIGLADNDPVVTWQAPASAVAVACALFACAPQFETGLDGNGPMIEEASFDRCAVLFHAAAPDRGTFALDSENDVGEYEATCADARTYDRVFEDLLAGCWAYDAFHLIAASRLIRIPPERVSHPDLPQPIVCPDLEGAGPPCFIAANQTFGLCWDGVCRPRCLQPSDCAPTSTPGEACLWACEPLADSLVGVCRTPS